MKKQDTLQWIVIAVAIYALYRALTFNKGKNSSYYRGGALPCNAGYGNMPYAGGANGGLYPTPKNYLDTPAIYGRWRCKDLANDCDCFLDGGAYKPCYNTGGIWTY